MQNLPHPISPLSAFWKAERMQYGWGDEDEKETDEVVGGRREEND